MKIAVLGTGMVGRALAGGLAGLGHDVAVGTRDPEATAARPLDDTSWTAWLQDHAGVRLARFDEAAQHAELVVHAGRGDAAVQLVTGLARHLDGKVLVDVSNPLELTPGAPPALFTDGRQSLAEQIQGAAPGARVVKALNTVTADLMVRPGAVAEGEHTVFVSGEDAEAKDVVQHLLAQLGHRDIIDLGGLDTARGTEAYLLLWLRLFGRLGTGMFSIKVVR